MGTIEDKTRNCNSWKKAQIKLNKFDEMLELIEKYPTKLMRHPISPRYELNK